MLKKAIGILGGMGPEASEKFYELLVRHAQKKYRVSRNDEYPEIYLASIPVPDFIASQKKQQEALRILQQRVRVMEKLPIGLFCIACNTAHLLLPDLQKVTRIPFISLLEELPKFVVKQRIQRVGILATPTTIKTKMYELPLKEKGIELIVPMEEDIKILGEIILQAVAGKNLEKNSIKLQGIARRLLEKGAQGIIEGCTELNFLMPKQYMIPVFDTLDILAQSVLKKYYKKDSRFRGNDGKIIIT